MRRVELLLPLLLVGACTQTTQIEPTTPITPPVQALPGLDRVMGRAPEEAIKLLGSPTLDRSEGTARHLQFARPSCVLDLYYYSDGPSAVPTARYAEARTRDGRPQDTTTCFQSQFRVQPLS